MRVGIALGSNLGDRAERLQQAVARLREKAQPPFHASRVYETEPVDCPPGSPRFLNAAVEFGFPGSIPELLEWLQTIERDAARPAVRPKNAPRTVDLDLIYADDHQCHTPELSLPHPRAMERLFVLVPFAEICPDRVLPGETRSLCEQINRLTQESPSPLLPTCYTL